jgi:hypothetical protein
MNNKYSNTLLAAAYSLGVNVEVLSQSLEHLRRASELKSQIDIQEFYTITLVLNPNNK